MVFPSWVDGLRHARSTQEGRAASENGAAALCDSSQAGMVTGIPLAKRLTRDRDTSGVGNSTPGIVQFDGMSFSV